MTNLKKLFNYEGINITFNTNDGVVYVNATEMAKPFGDSKRPKNWFSNQSTTQFLDALSKGRNLPLESLVKIIRGGNEPGTWLHEDVAIEFSRWLSPAFSIWCNDRIKELLTTGQSNIKPLSQVEIIAQSAQLLLEMERKQLDQEKRINLLEAKSTTSPDYFTIAGYASLHGLNLNLSECQKLGRKASSICNSMGWVTNTVPDPRFGRAKTYPTEALSEAFNQLGYSI